MAPFTNLFRQQLTPKSHTKRPCKGIKMTGWMKGGGRYWPQQCPQFGPSLPILPGLTPLIIKRVTFLPQTVKGKSHTILIISNKSISLTVYSLDIDSFYPQQTVYSAHDCLSFVTRSFVATLYGQSTQPSRPSYGENQLLCHQAMPPMCSPK